MFFSGFKNGIALVQIETHNYGYIDTNCHLLGSNFYSNIMIRNVEEVTFISNYMILYSRNNKELYLYDDKLNLIQTVKLDSYHII